MLDPYATLGVDKSAPIEEIKKSYRQLAKKYHPDLNPGNKEAEKKFKEIGHAYDLIGTPEARAKFDRGETDEQRQQQYEEFTRQQQGRGRKGRPFFHQTQQDGGRYSQSFGEDIGGDSFFEELFRSARAQRGGEDVAYTMEVDFREAALGAQKVISLPNGKNLEVKVPAGIESGKKLRFKGQGEAGAGQGPAGDAYVEIKVRPLEGFKRNGLDIETELPISFLEALTGADVQAPTLDGPVLLKVPPGVSTGSKLRIKGKGAGAEGARGNQIVVLKVVMPKAVDPALKEAAEGLRAKFGYDPRVQ